MVSNRHLRIQRNFSVSPVGFKHLSLETMKNKKHRQAINDFYTFSNMFGLKNGLIAILTTRGYYSRIKKKYSTYNFLHSFTGEVTRATLCLIVKNWTFQDYPIVLCACNPDTYITRQNFLFGKCNIALDFIYKAFYDILGNLGAYISPY